MTRLCSGRGIRTAVPLFLLTLAVLALNGAGTAAEAREFPSDCGGEGERPCTIFEHIPSCMSGLVEHFGLNKCIRLDSDGYPTFCGGPNERACTVVEHIPSCKSGLDEIPFPGGTCVQRDSQGFPPGCGHLNQDACTIDLQIRFGIRSCSSGLIEVPFPGGKCIQPDADGFPPFCGGENERACTIVEHIPSCKAGLAESLTTQPDGSLISTCVGPPPSCGRNGQRPCLWVKTLGPTHPDYARYVWELASTVAARGGVDEAEKLFRQALDIRRNTLPARDPEIATALASLGTLLLDRGAPALAEPLLREAVGIYREALPADDHTRRDAERALARCQTAPGLSQEAVAHSSFSRHCALRSERLILTFPVQAAGSPIRAAGALGDEKIRIVPVWKTLPAVL